MKTIKKQLKAMVVLFILAISLNMVAQKGTENKGLFLRIYNMEGKKINKGQFRFINDSILGIRRYKKLVQVHVRDIGKIKTKRSAGNNVLVGSLVGGATLSIVGAATSEQKTETRYFPYLGPYEYTTGNTPGEGAAEGAFAGILGGALVGLGTSMFKNSKSYQIAGDINNLKSFGKAISE